MSKLGEIFWIWKSAEVHNVNVNTLEIGNITDNNGNTYVEARGQYMMDFTRPFRSQCEWFSIQLERIINYSLVLDRESTLRQLSKCGPKSPSNSPNIMRTCAKATDSCLLS